MVGRESETALLGGGVLCTSDGRPGEFDASNELTGAGAAATAAHYEEREGE
jgi:hypothetical protein